MSCPGPIRVCSEDVTLCQQASEALWSSCSSSHAMSNNVFFYLLREVIVHSEASANDVAASNAHSIRGIATSAFFRNWSLASVLEADSWRSNTVFTSFY